MARLLKQNLGKSPGNLCSSVAKSPPVVLGPVLSGVDSACLLSQFEYCNFCICLHAPCAVASLAT